MGTCDEPHWWDRFKYLCREHLTSMRTDDYVDLGDLDFSDLDFDSLRNTYGSPASSTLNTPLTRTPNAAVGVGTVGASPFNTTVGIERRQLHEPHDSGCGSHTHSTSTSW